MKGWKTLLVAIATSIFGALEAFDYTSVIEGSNAGFIIAGLGILFAWLRGVTTTALGKSE